MIFTQEAPLTRRWFSGRSCIRLNWNLRVNFEEGGNRSARRKPSKSGWDRLKLNPHTTFAVEVEGVRGHIAEHPMRELLQNNFLLGYTSSQRSITLPNWGFSFILAVSSQRASILNFCCVEEKSIWSNVKGSITEMHWKTNNIHQIIIQIEMIFPQQVGRWIYLVLK